MPMSWSNPRCLGQGGNASLLSNESGDTGMLRTPDDAVFTTSIAQTRQAGSVVAAVWVSPRGNVAISRARCWESIRGHQPAGRDQGQAHAAPCSAYRGSTARERPVSALLRVHIRNALQPESTPPVLLQPFPNELMQAHFPVLIRGTQAPQAWFTVQGTSVPAPAAGGRTQVEELVSLCGTVGRLMKVTAVGGVVFV